MSPDGFSDTADVSTEHTVQLTVHVTEPDATLKVSASPSPTAGTPFLVDMSPWVLHRIHA
jgi:hypothetical protein